MFAEGWKVKVSSWVVLDGILFEVQFPKISSAMLNGVNKMLNEINDSQIIWNKRSQ